MGNDPGNFLVGTDIRQTPERLDTAWTSYACKGMVVVTGPDLANKTSTGVFSSNSIKVIVDWRPHSGFAGVASGDNVYQLYNH